MKKYYVVDDGRDMIDYYGPYDTRKEAEDKAHSIWAHLTTSERKGRYVAAGMADANLDEDDNLLDTFEELYVAE
jgi:hypothetical protein